MAYRLKPGRLISQSARDIGIEQIDRVLAGFAAKTGRAAAIHEARKATKRLRALLRLIKPGLPKGAFAESEAQIKQIARVLAGARDAQAMLDTVRKLEGHDVAATVVPVSVAVRAHLQAKCAEAESGLDGAAANRLRRQLKDARASFASLNLEPNGFEIVAATLAADYRRARRAFKHAYRSGMDEAFHDWRKYVQRHWRQLLLVAPSWPKAIRPHIALARTLSEILGDDHDLYVLAGLLKENADALGTHDEVEAYLSLCQTRQAELRRAAHDLGARLLAEKPSSLARRVTTYWETAENFDDEASNIRDNNVIILKR